MPPKFLAFLGLSLILAATVAFNLAGRWIDTRIFTPLDFNVTLDDPHLKTPAFEINLKEEYSVWLEPRSESWEWYEDTPCSYRAVNGSRWRIYKLGSDAGHPRELWADNGITSDSRRFYSHSFSAGPGKYELEWDLPAAMPCLNHTNPRLHVTTGEYEYREAIGVTRIFCFFLGGTGLALLPIAYKAKTRVVRPRGPRIFPEMALRQVMPFRRSVPLRLISEAPNWGLVWGGLLMVLLFLFMTMNGPLTPKGLLVGWKKTAAVVWVKSPWPEALEIYVATPARFFVNTTEVRREDLRAKLLEQLGRRVEWTVYVEADIDTNFGDAVYAMDVIRACGGKVSWITPRMRKEWSATAELPATAK